MVDVPKLMQNSLIIMRDIENKDTGNMAFNATNARLLHNGFRIELVWDIANYAHFVNNRFDFWGRGFNAIAAYVTGEVNGHKNNMNDTRARVAEASENNEARQETMLNSLQSTIKRG